MNERMNLFDSTHEIHSINTHSLHNAGDKNVQNRMFYGSIGDWITGLQTLS